MTEIYKVTIAPSSDPNTATFVSSLTVNADPAIVAPVVDSQEFGIPTGASFIFAIAGVNAAGTVGAFSDPITGIAGPGDTTPAKPATPAFVFVRTDP